MKSTLMQPGYHAIECAPQATSAKNKASARLACGACALSVVLILLASGLATTHARSSASNLLQMTMHRNPTIATQVPSSGKNSLHRPMGVRTAPIRGQASLSTPTSQFGPRGRVQGTVRHATPAMSQEWQHSDANMEAMVPVASHESQVILSVVALGLMSGLGMYLISLLQSSPKGSAKQWSMAAIDDSTLLTEPGKSLKPGIDEQAFEETVQDMVAKDPVLQEKLETVRKAQERVAALQIKQSEMVAEMKASQFSSAMEIAELEADKERQIADATIAVARVGEESAREALYEAQLEMRKWQQDINETAEKIESIKAAGIGAVAATLACLPLAVTMNMYDDWLAFFFSVASFTGSGLLMAIVYRYAIRQDMGNRQLKSGVVAAFALTRALGIADDIQGQVNGHVTSEMLSQAALLAGQSMITFGFVAIALELALQRGYLKAFGAAEGMME